MLTEPDISDEDIFACVHDSFGLCMTHATFLPLGADINTAVYRVSADDGPPYFLKLRWGNFDEVAVAVAAFLHAQGIRRIMAPITTTTGQLWVHAHGIDWMLYPFFEGKNGFEVAPSRAQWIALGESMRAVHTAILPADLAARVRREAYSPRLRCSVRAFDTQVEQNIFDDPIAADFARLWTAKRDEIHSVVERAEELAQALEPQAVELVLCHADLHGGNVMLGASDALAIVDWDEIILAPKERDLMFVDGGLYLNQEQEAAWFYTGYGDTAINPVALAYYRYERIVADFAAYGEQIFGMQGSAEDREEGLRQVSAQFLPNNVIDFAHRSYRKPA